MNDSIIWEPDNLLERISELGPGICTVGVEGCEPLVFDVHPEGWFGIERNQDPWIRARFYRLCSEAGAAGIIMRTFTDERVEIPHGADPERTIEVPVKELRGFDLWVEETPAGTVFHYEQLPASVLRECYSYDAATGKPISPPGEADHRFVGD